MDRGRLSLWPHQSTQLLPETSRKRADSPDPPDVFCREWVKGSSVSKPCPTGVDSSKTPLIAINIFGRRVVRLANIFYV
jgi:hypothetical protein